MAKKQDAGTAAVVVKNLSPGPRDYPLKGKDGKAGESLYLLPKGKGVKWPEISSDQVSDAMRLAEKKGAIELIAKNVTETPKEANE